MNPHRAVSPLYDRRSRDRVHRGRQWLALSVLLCGCGGGAGDGPAGPPASTVVSVAVEPTSASLFAGDLQQLTATARDKDGATVAGKTPTWSTSAAGVASVSSSGLVTALGAGTATITASVDGRSGASTITVNAVPAAVSQNMGALGGTLSSPLVGGAGLTLQVPQGALLENSTLSVVPERPGTGQLTRFLLRPSSATFLVPIQLTLDLAAPVAANRILALSYRSPAGPAFIPLTKQTATRYVAAVTSFGGAPPPFAGARVARSISAGASPLIRSYALGAAATDDGTEVVVTDATLTAYFDSTRAALAAMQAQPTLANAIHLSSVMHIIARAFSLPGFQPDGRDLLLQWKPMLCPTYEAAIDRFSKISTASPFDFIDYFRELDDAVAWEGTAQAMDDPALQLALPTCNSQFLAAVKHIDSLFVPRIINEFDTAPAATFDVKFDVFLTSHIPHFLQLIALRDGLGLQEFTTELRIAVATILDHLRVAAWGACRNRNDQDKLASLLNVELGVSDALSNYTTADLANDAEECGTNLDWRVRFSDGRDKTTGTAGGVSSGVNSPPVNLTLGTDEVLVIRGLLRPIQCPGDARTQTPGTVNNETIQVSAQAFSRQQVLTQRSVPLGGNGEYFRSDSVVITAAQLRAFAQLTDTEEGLVVIPVERVGMSCSRGFSVLPNRYGLAEFDVTLATGTCTSTSVASAGEERVTAARRRTPGSALTIAAGASTCTTFNGNIVIQSQSGFSQLAGIDRINGNLMLSPSSANAITTLDLRELSQLVEVTGAIYIANIASLQRLDGLRHITTAVGSLSLWNLPGVSDITPVGNMSRIGYLTLSNVPQVTSLIGLRNTTINGLLVQGMAGLASISGLDHLSSTPTDILVYNNPLLASLPSLRTVTAVTGRVEIIGNASLAHLDDLAALRTVGGNLSFYNPAQTSLAGLAGLQRVGGHFTVAWDQAPLLSAISFPALTHVGGQLQISGDDSRICRSPRSLRVQLPALVSVGSVFIQLGPADNVSPPACSISVGIGAVTAFDELAVFGTSITSAQFGALSGTGGLVIGGTSLTSVTLGTVQLGYLRIDYNARLTTLGASSGRVTGLLEIRNNPLLSNAAAVAWAQLFSPGSTNILLNGSP